MADGIRTRDHPDHNRGLYQLSYRHREGGQDSGALMQAPDRSAIVELSREEIDWVTLREQRIARLGCHVGGLTYVVPVTTSTTASASTP